MSLSFYVILIGSESSDNVGSVSRIMGNYDFENLILVEPKCKDDKRSELLSHTKKGLDIFKKRLIYNSLNDAIRALKLNVTLGFTRRAGKTREISNDYRSYFNCFFENNKSMNLNIGLLFGREDTGLLEGEIKLCNSLIYIPASPVSPSLNLSHAVGIILNEIFLYTSKNYDERLSDLALDVEKQFSASTIAEREKFYNEIIKAACRKKLFIKNDLDTFRRMFERIFTSPVIFGKDLRLLKRLLMRFLYSDVRETDDKK